MYACKICGAELGSVKRFLQHCRIHSNLPKLRLHCCYRSCLKTSNSLSGLKMHVSRDHNKPSLQQRLVTVGGDGLSLQCSVLSCTVTFASKTLLVKHLRQHIEEGLTIDCPIVHCHKKYNVTSSLSCHLSRDHINWSASDVRCANYEPHLVARPTELPAPLSPFQSDDCTGNDDEDDVPERFNKDELTKNLSLFFSRLSTRQLIPDTTIDIIAQELQNVHLLNTMHLKQFVVDALSANGASQDIIQKARKAFDEGDVLKECIGVGGVLSTSVRRASFVKQNFNFVKPLPVYVGMTSKNKARHCHYIPIRKSIEALVQDQSIANQCLSPCCSTDKILRDFTDGSIYKKCTMDSSKAYLPLILFQDSFEIVNPLGSAKTRHKVLGVYFVLGSLQCHNRSNIDNIQLVMLVNEHDFDRVGQHLFHQLVADLQALEAEGVLINGIRHFIIVSAIAGDNLGSHCIGGFVKNFSTVAHMCRFCVLTRAEFDNGCISANDNRIRTPHSYNAAVAKLTESELTIVDGIKFASIFNSLKSFHVCSPGLPPCVAHDLFEGVVAYDLPLFLRYFIKKKWISLELLNKRIECIKLLGADSKVRPAAVHKNLQRLAGSASQNWCFLRIVSVLICDLVQVEDAVYQAILVLRLVVEYVMAPALSHGQVAYMKVLVEDYLERRQTLFPDVKLRPKHHYMTHYASLTLQFGPLVRLWTMRFESKHQYFKRCMRSSRNFVNVTGMLANRHQMLQAYLSAGKRFASDLTVVKSTVDVDFSRVSHHLEVLKRSLGQNFGQLVSEITFKGTMYSRSQVLPLHIDNDKKEVLFGQIELISVCSEPHFVVGLRNGQYSHDIGCYVVGEITDVQCFALQCFADCYPLNIYHLNSNAVVILKHQLVDTDDGSN